VFKGWSVWLNTEKALWCIRETQQAGLLLAMPLSFLPLSVIPKLKLSDLGLIDVDQFTIVPIEVCPTE